MRRRLQPVDNREQPLAAGRLEVSRSSHEDHQATHTRGHACDAQRGDKQENVAHSDPVGEMRHRAGSKLRERRPSRGRRGRHRRNSSSPSRSNSKSLVQDFRFPTGRQAGRENTFREMARYHPGLLLEKGAQMIKHHCAAVPGSGSGERLPASVVMYLENVLRVLKGATLSESEARVHETLASALGHSPRASLANPGDVIRSRSCHLDKWVQSGGQKGDALVQTPSPSRGSPTRLKINTRSNSGIGALRKIQALVVYLRRHLSGVNSSASIQTMATPRRPRWPNCK